MSRFEETPLSEECINLMTEIFRYAVECNSTPTRRESTGDKPTFFVEFSGHISEMSVSVHRNGYYHDPYADNADEKPIILLDTTARVCKTDNEYRKDLENVLALMHAIYETWALNERIKREPSGE